MQKKKNIIGKGRPKDKEDTELFWADQVAKDVIGVRGSKPKYICAAGISPSGVIHFGNFREVMTVDLVSRALQAKGKKTRFIYSWDDFDRFRKVPANVPKEFSKYVGMPYTKIPDPFKCHKSYAEHFEKIFEESLVKVGVFPEFIYQTKKYESCDYAEEIRQALNSRQVIRKILDKYRDESLAEDWFPLEVYCEKCHTDFTRITEYDEQYTIAYECKCGHSSRIDFRKKGIVKLPWRVDWPMRWKYEGVDFEPGGKEHSTPGGSRTTAAEIQEAVWSTKPPVYKKYDYIILKGVGGKMSGSLGNVIMLDEVLEVFEPAIVRYMFAGTRPGSEFFVSFDLDVLKVYEDFDRCERIYFGREKAKTGKEMENIKRIYELSVIEMPEKLPLQPSFRHLTTLIQMMDGDVEKVVRHIAKEIKSKDDAKRLRLRLGCAKRWIEKYAPEEFKFKVQERVSKSINLTERQRNSVREIAALLKEKSWDEQSLFNEFYKIIDRENMKPPEFFEAFYLVLLNQKKGPKLAPFIIELGDRARKLLWQVK